MAVRRNNRARDRSLLIGGRNAWQPSSFRTSIAILAAGQISLGRINKHGRVSVNIGVPAHAPVFARAQGWDTGINVTLLDDRVALRDTADIFDRGQKSTTDDGIFSFAVTDNRFPSHVSHHMRAASLVSMRILYTLSRFPPPPPLVYSRVGSQSNRSVATTCCLCK